MLSIKWDDTYCNGIPLLDTQNKNFVEMLNLLFEYQDTNPDTSLLYQKFREVETYAREHFRREELFLERFYPDELADHRSQHSLFLDNLKCFSCNVVSDGPDAVNDLSCYIRDWAVIHIGFMDKSITSCIKIPTPTI